METPLATEPEIRQRIWLELQRATHDRHHEWRVPVLATVGVGHLPQARTVVLRQADARLHSLQIYTDSRSPKVGELLAAPDVLLVFWSKRLGWQLRVQAVASVQQSGPEVDAVWERVSQSAAAGDYLAASAPGERLGNPSAASAADTVDAVESGRQAVHHLAIITAQVQSIDWLELARSGHRRAALTPDSWQWLVP